MNNAKFKLHRNSQKRYYIKNAIYFIITNTFKGYPYFENDILCELLVYEIEICKQLQKFKIHGYKINPEHIHILVQPNHEYNYSTIIRSLKTNFSRDANRVLGYNNSSIMPKARSRNLAFDNVHEIFHKCQNQFISQVGKNHNIPPFKWQSSFYDHIIRNEFDYLNHLKYIEKQWIKHNLKEDKWCWIIGQNKNKTKKIDILY